MMKNKKILFALIALLAVVALMVGIYIATGTADNSTEPTFSKNFTVIVVHSDGTEKTFTYGTNETYLGPVLVAEGLIVESDSPGLYNTVDGETADWNVDQSYWSFYVGDKEAMFGMNDAELHDGDVFKLVYTK